MTKIISMVSRLEGEIRKNGVTNTYYKVKEKRAKDLKSKDYETHRLAALPTAEELERQKKRNFLKDITFSIVVPAYQTSELFLRQMIESVLGQTFCRVELCIADGSKDDSVETIVSEYAEKDARVKYRRLAENKGISENTNAGLAMATGQYIGFLDHDDVLESHALYEMRMALARNPHADILYSDEDKVSFDLEHYFDPHYKSDFNPDLLRSNNYICHFLVIKRELLESVGGFRERFDGAQDFDLILRLTEKAEEIIHIPKVLYHWRSHEASTASNPMSKLYAYEAGRQAVEEQLKRCGEAGIVKDTRFYGFYEVDYKASGDMRADLIIFSCNEGNLKKILNKFSGDLRRQSLENIIYYDNEFNKFVTFPREWKPEGDVLIFAEAGLTGVAAEGLEQLAVNCLRKGIGMAGGRILSNRGELLYGRMEPDHENALAYADAGLPKGFTGYYHKSILQQNTEGVSYRLFAIRRELYEAWEPESGASSEELMMQLCAFVKQKGYRISYVPIATATKK